jgi:hypothetical protein
LLIFLKQQGFLLFTITDGGSSSVLLALEPTGALSSLWSYFITARNPLQTWLLVKWKPEEPHSFISMKSV